MNEVYLRDLHREVREELVRVDGKLSVLLATFGIAVSLVAGALLTGDADLGALTRGWPIVFGVAVTLAIAGITLLVVALSPITRNVSPREKLGYFGHVAEYDTVAAFRGDLEHLDHDEVHRLVEQTHTLSHIVRRKYRLATAGTIVSGLAVVLAVLTAVLGSG